MPPRAGVGLATAFSSARESAAEVVLEVARPVVAAGEQTSTSSASLRAVEVVRAPEEAGLSELRAIAATQAPASSAGVEPGPAPVLGATPAPPAPKRGWLLAGSAALLALAVGLGLPPRAPAARGAAASQAVPSEARQRAASTRDTVAPVVSSSPLEAVPAAVEGPALAAPASAPVYDQKALDRALLWGITNAEECHRGGRPSGTSRATLTFGPAGKIIKAELSGEPIASAPVSKCILHYLRSMMIPAFPGPEFTLSREITLR